MVFQCVVVGAVGDHPVGLLRRVARLEIRVGKNHMMIANGTPITTVSERLVHATAAVTGKIYAPDFRSADAATAEALEDFLGEEEDADVYLTDCQRRYYPDKIGCSALYWSSINAPDEPSVKLPRFSRSTEQQWGRSSTSLRLESWSFANRSPVTAALPT